MARHDHQFDPVSGWCARCGLRDDGRLIGSGGRVYQDGNRHHPTTEQDDYGQQH